MSTMTAPPPIDLAALGKALAAQQAVPDPVAERPNVRLARRVTMLEAKGHFDAGGDVVVSERVHEETCLVTPNTTIHNARNTTWKELREQVAMWKNRHPNQRYYIVPDTAAAHGYICKKCKCPAPVGVGFIATGEDAAERSAAITACPCGYSRLAPQDPPPPNPDRKTFDVPQVEASATMVEAITEAIEALIPGNQKATVEKREKFITEICGRVSDVPVYGIEIDDARLPIGDGVDFDNAVVETDGYGRAVTILAFGTPIWDPQ